MSFLDTKSSIMMFGDAQRRWGLDTLHEIYINPQEKLPILDKKICFAEYR